MAPQKQSREERLRKRREKERERYARIRSDPTLWKHRQDSLAETYEKRKEVGKVKMVSDMSNRERRAKRKQWRKNTETYRQKKRVRIAAENFLRENSPAPSFTDGEVRALAAPAPPLEDRRKSAGRKKLKRERSKLARENFRLREENARIQKALNRAKKRMEKFRKGMKNLTGDAQESPNTKVQAIMKEGTQAIKRRLLFGESLVKNLTDNIRNMRSHKEKKMFKSFIAGNTKFAWKYKLMNEFKEINERLFSKNHGRVTNDRRSVAQTRKLAKNIQSDVISFFEQDDVSRISPGKKDVVVRNKVKKQKRFISETLKNLHKRFCDTHSYKIGLTLFCKLRPFWVLIPKAGNRETCKCMTHENVILIIGALHRARVLRQSNLSSVLRQLCCDEMNVLCLHRKCSCCEDNFLEYLTFDGNDIVEYSQWLYKKDSYFDKKSNKEKTVKRVTKEKLKTTLYELVKILEHKLELLLVHQGNMRHQYAQMKLLKSQLTDKEVLIHVDFSENYCVKYGTEIQSFHFGGSRSQISLHTVVVYFRADEYAPLSMKSLCTLSKCLDHDAPAIWAHLQPVFEYVKSMKPNITKVHFWSDGPSNQYKNKTMFYLLGHALKENFVGLQLATWNYHETGHGKGPVDGVGACIKQTADRAVACGKDIDSFETLMEEIKKVRNIYTTEIEGEQISKMRHCIPRNLKMFQGTMKTHQAVYNPRAAPGIVKLKSLSCHHCEDCDHFEIGSYLIAEKLNDDGDYWNPTNHLELVAPRADETTPDQMDRMMTVSDDSLTTPEPTPIMQPPSPFLTGELEVDDFVLIKFLAKKKYVYYVAKVIKKYASQDYDVSFLRKKRYYYVFPPNYDISSISLSDVISILKTPKRLSRDRFSFSEDLSGFAIC